MTDVSHDRLRVLIVDDEQSIADTLAVIIGLSGYETRAVYSGQAAVEAAFEFKPDILLTDYSMPGMNGMDAAAAIKKHLPGLRVLMLSGQLLVEEFAPFKARGFNFLLLQKPMHPNELMKSLATQDISSDPLAHRAQILNVDDMESHRYSITRLLTRAGFEVSEAATGTDAIKRALESQPDLVLLDIHLPDTTGYDVCEQLRRNPQTAEIAVVHITASDKNPEAAERSASSGADEYLTYPIVPKRLIHRIRELLQLRYLKSEKPELQ